MINDIQARILVLGVVIKNWATSTHRELISEHMGGVLTIHERVYKPLSQTRFIQEALITLYKCWNL